MRITHFEISLSLTHTHTHTHPPTPKHLALAKYRANAGQHRPDIQPEPHVFWSRAQIAIRKINFQESPAPNTALSHEPMRILPHSRYSK